MASIIETYQQYREAKAQFLQMATVSGKAASQVNGIPVFSIYLTPEASDQLAKVRDLDSQLRETEGAIGSRSDPQTGNYPASLENP